MGVLTLAFFGLSRNRTRSVWIPPGTWVETETGTIRTGAAGTGTVLTKYWDLSEVPGICRQRKEGLEKKRGGVG